ncbi:MAG: DNA-directed RNA polymerase subunit alpha [Candidatus Geothermincolales bacterium]
MVLEMQKPHVVVEKLEGSYGKFVVEPLERGLGHTIGNSLRRILLSSIPGAAVTAVRIDGVVHEFTALEGVKEDVIEIILNLKGLVMRIDGEGQYALYVDEKGPKVVTAGDIQAPAGVEIINPDMKICTLNEKGQIKMELTAQKGRGYVSSERLGKPREISGTIPLDAMFSPVVRVAYHVEDTRVGQRTDYDKLIIEIETDGSVDPKEALVKAAQILISHAQIFLSLAEGEEMAEAIFGEEAAASRSKEYDRPIEELELPVRVLNCLHRGGINTIGQLIEKTEEDLLALRSFGARSIEDVKEKLAKVGLSLRSKES